MNVYSVFIRPLFNNALWALKFQANSSYRSIELPMIQFFPSTLIGDVLVTKTGM